MDKNLIEEAINDPKSFFNENSHLKNDRNFMTELVSRNGSLLTFASEKLQNDKEMIIFAVNQVNGVSLFDLNLTSFNAYQDRDIVSICVEKGDCSVLSHTLCPFGRDKDIMFRAVINNGMALEYASPDIQNDRQIVMSAMRQNPLALQFASKELQNDKELISMCEGLLNDRETVLFATRTYPNILDYVSEELRDDKQIVFNAVKRNGMLLDCASERLKRDPHVVVAAVKDTTEALRYVSKELTQHTKFWSYMVDKIPEAIDFVPKNLKEEVLKEKNNEENKNTPRKH